MEYVQNGKMSWIDRMAMILAIVLGILLIILLGINEEQDKKKAQELAEIAKQQRLEERSFLDAVQDEYNADLDIISQYLPGIICWGDSLTAGAGGDGVTYPKVLQAQIQKNICDPYDLLSAFDSKYAYLAEPEDYAVNIPVVNMGVGGEDSRTIVGRNGAIPFVVSEALTIPADKSPVEICFTSEDGFPAAPLRQGNAGLNPVKIGGIEGMLSIVQESYTSKEYTYYFTRSVAGESKRVGPGTEIVTAASSQYPDYITVIFIGQNGGYADIEDLIRQQRAIIDHQIANQDRYIIVGLHTGTKESRQELEEAMLEEYGDQYINLREYMATQAMADAGLEPTEKDREMMEQGATPASLLSDSVHFNAVGYELIGKLIYNTMDELGYFEEVQRALTNNGD